MAEIRRFEQWQDLIARLFPEYNKDDESTDRVLSRSVTFQVTDACNLCCSYCYQINKGHRKMSIETAKKFIDLLLTGEKGMKNYINPEISPGIVLDFIGGEPFLEVELIDQIVSYFEQRAIEMMHPWATKYMISICSNGVLYSDPRVQSFLNKHKHHMSFSVTIDGNKQLHDSCRVFHDGSGSYDLAVAAAKDWMDKGGYMGSKITIAPGNITYLYDALVHMVELGYQDINANCVYEKGWNAEHATELYNQMKKVSDYFLDNNLDFSQYYCSLYEPAFFHPKSPEDNNNWCFKAGTKVLTPSGNVNIEDLKIGDEVITGSGNIKPVTNNMSRFADDTQIVRIAGMDPLFTTADHPILTKRFLYIGNKGVRRYAEPQFIKASELKKGDKIAIHKHSFGNIHVDNLIAYIVGRYIGDGWDSTTGYKICSSYDEAEELTQILDKAGVKYSTSDYRTVKQFNIFKENTELLSILSDAGHYAHGKRIPGVVFLWDESSVRSLLKGLFDADGYFVPEKQQQKFNTVSAFLAQDVMTLLRGLGYYPMCYLNKRAGSHVIEGRTVNVRDRYEVYYYLDPSRSRRCSFDKENNVIWTTVYSSTPSESYEVYNLTVADEHTFIANGVVVHNCGGTGMMISCDPDGFIYPCIRYMESSLGTDQPPLRIGDVNNGVGVCQEHKCTIDCLQCITRRSQSTDECFYCPIGEGCSWCSAYNYQVFGTPNARATFICIMHKARALANVYFWNKYYRKRGEKKYMKNYVPDEWALEIIDEDELNMLKELSTPPDTTYVQTNYSNED